MKIETALIIAVPEAEPLVKSWRDRFDSSAAVGVPAHITILYPFKPPHTITPLVQAELRQLFAPFAAFDFALVKLRRFPQVLYLAPSPAAPFQALTQAVYERYPDTPPYGGAFAEITPHLTLVDSGEPDRLNALERDFMYLNGAQLPVRTKASEVLLIDNTSGRWEVRETFRLAAHG